MPINWPTTEDMNCTCCETVTGHEIVNGVWVCVICSTPSK